MQYAGVATTTVTALVVITGQGRRVPLIPAGQGAGHDDEKRHVLPGREGRRSAMIRDHGQMAGGVRRGKRPADSKRMLSFMLFAQGAILIILTAIVALQAEWLGALGALGLGLLFLLVGTFVRRRGH